MNKPPDPSRWMPADVTMPLPPSKTRLVVRDLVLEGKLRDRIASLQGAQPKSRRT